MDTLLCWITIRIGKMAKRISISNVLDDLFDKRDELEVKEIEEVAIMFGLKPETIMKWLHRHDPDDTE